MAKNKDEKYYENKQVSLDSFYTAAFLLAKGFRFSLIDYTNPKRAQFVFQDHSDIDGLIHSYNFAPENSPEVMIDARKFVTAVKALKEGLWRERESL